MSWRGDKRTSAQRGYSYKWQQARLEFLRDNPFCVMCKAQNKLTIANVVDHKIPHKGDQQLFWDRSNWQPLCKTHHDGEKKALETTGKVKQTIGTDGWPVE